MISISDSLGAIPQKRLVQAKLFIEKYGPPMFGYSVSEADMFLSDSDFRITYSTDLYAGRSPKSEIFAQGNSGIYLLTTHLYDAIRLLVLMTFDEGWWEKLKDLDLAMNNPHEWSSIGINREEILKESVNPYLPGVYLAPRGKGFAYFSVDTNGEVTIEAEALQLGTVAFQLAAMKSYSELGVGEKFGQLASMISS